MPRRVWTREKLIEHIRELHAQGADMSAAATMRRDSSLFASARSRSHFGSWSAAIAAAGLDYDGIRRIHHRWSRDEIVRQIRAHYEDGQDLLAPEFKDKYRDLYLAACSQRYFRSWRNAIVAAGLDHEKMREKYVWTQDRILRTIREMHREGERLSWSHIEESCPGIYRAARRPENFGSWRNALTVAGVRSS
jgi:hypothetical protein